MAQFSVENPGLAFPDGLSKSLTFRTLLVTAQAGSAPPEPRVANLGSYDDLRIGDCHRVCIESSATTA